MSQVRITAGDDADKLSELTMMKGGLKVKKFELQIWQGLSLSDDSEHIHSFERLKLISVCGGEIISVLQSFIPVEDLGMSYNNDSGNNIWRVNIDVSRDKKTKKASVPDRNNLRDDLMHHAPQSPRSRFISRKNSPRQQQSQNCRTTDPISISLKIVNF